MAADPPVSGDLQQEASALEITGWQVVGAAAAGTSHDRLGLPCQDALAYQTDGHRLIVALSDGAGTADRSHFGAQTAVEAALDAAWVALEAGEPSESEGWQEILSAAFTAARLALESLAELEAQPLRAYAATLILLVATADLSAVAQIGDGAVVAGETPDDLFLVSRAQRGEYANETYFLTQEDAFEHMQITVVNKSLNALAVMSDGLTRLAIQLPDHTPHLRFFQPLFAFTANAQEEEQAARHLEEFLTSERVCARTDDDKSLVLAVRLTVSEVEIETEDLESE
jgi:hypothetical protein